MKNRVIGDSRLYCLYSALCLSHFHVLLLSSLRSFRLSLFVPASPLASIHPSVLPSLVSFSLSHFPCAFPSFSDRTISFLVSNTGLFPAPAHVCYCLLSSLSYFSLSALAIIDMKDHPLSSLSFQLFVYLSFSQQKTVPLSLSISPNGSYFACYGKDQHVRVFEFLSGKMICDYPETMQVFAELQKVRQTQTRQTGKMRSRERQRETERDREFGRQAGGGWDV